MDDLLAEVQQCLGYTFHDETLLQCALTHPSFSAEASSPTPDNQRLEFLGDAVLQLVVTELIYEAFDDLDEGRMTRVRSALTREPALAEYAERLRLGPALRLGVGEARSGGHERASNLGDACEAVLGAMYLDGGQAPVRELLRRLTGEALTSVDDVLISENPKGALQEMTQERFGETPTYEVISVAGPEHDPTFEVAVCVRGEEIARATAGSRKNAESEAARFGLKCLGNAES